MWKYIHKSTHTHIHIHHWLKPGSHLFVCVALRPEVHMKVIWTHVHDAGIGKKFILCHDVRPNHFIYTSGRNAMQAKKMWTRLNKLHKHVHHHTIKFLKVMGKSELQTDKHYVTQRHRGIQCISVWQFVTQYVFNYWTPNATKSLLLCC